jgi:hypothetical protein
MRTIKSNRTLGRDLLQMFASCASAGPICLSALVVCSIGTFVSAAILTVPVAAHDWMFCVEIAVYIGWAPGVIVAVCGLSVPKELVVRTVLAGGLISALLAAWYLDRLFAALAAV